MLLIISRQEEAKNSILLSRSAILRSNFSLSLVSCSWRFLSSSRSWASWTMSYWFSIKQPGPALPWVLWAIDLESAWR
jgi:hypothetical protein